MSALRSSIERLRPLLGEKCWDYCVFWGVNEDESSIEFLGCCCGGVKGDQRSGRHFFPVNSLLPCRDMVFEHQRTRACEALHKLPSFMPMDSGNHTQALLSNKPRWIYLPNMSDMDHSEEMVTTMALVPVAGGLMELFVSKHVEEDEDFVEFVMAVAQCNMNLPREHQEGKQIFRPYGLSLKSGDHFQSDQAINNEPLSMWNQQYLHHQTSSKSQIEFMGNIQGHGGSLLIRTCNVHGFPEDYEETSEHGCTGKSDGSNEESGKTSRNRAKNIFTERRRRKKLNDRILQLRSLVPKISKMDKASTLTDAIQYIKELEQEQKSLQDELEETAQEKNRNQNSGLSDHGAKCAANKYANSSKQSSGPYCSTENKDHHMEPQVEMSSLGGQEYCLKILCEHRPKGFMRLMESMNALGLEVTNTNLTTFEGLVLYVLTVEKRDESEVVQADQLKESLLEISYCSSNGN